MLDELLRSVASAKSRAENDLKDAVGLAQARAHPSHEVERSRREVKTEVKKHMSQSRSTLDLCLTLRYVFSWVQRFTETYTHHLSIPRAQHFEHLSGRMRPEENPGRNASRLGTLQAWRVARASSKTPPASPFSTSSCAGQMQDDLTQPQNQQMTPTRTSMGSATAATNCSNTGRPNYPSGLWIDTPKLLPRCPTVSTKAMMCSRTSTRRRSKLDQPLTMLADFELFAATSGRIRAEHGPNLIELRQTLGQHQPNAVEFGRPTIGNSRRALGQDLSGYFGVSVERPTWQSVCMRPTLDHLATSAACSPRECVQRCRECAHGVAGGGSPHGVDQGGAACGPPEVRSTAISNEHGSAISPFCRSGYF